MINRKLVCHHSGIEKEKIEDAIAIRITYLKIII